MEDATDRRGCNIIRASFVAEHVAPASTVIRLAMWINKLRHRTRATDDDEAACWTSGCVHAAWRVVVDVIEFSKLRVTLDKRVAQFNLNTFLQETAHTEAD